MGITSQRGYCNEKKVFLLLLLCAVIVFNSSGVFSQNDIAWTEDELEFIKAHPVVKVGVDHHAS
jgi:hypothetical protein